MGMFDKVKKLADNAAQVVQQTNETVSYVKNSFQLETPPSKEENPIEKKKGTTSVKGGIYDEQLENLIELSLSNGELTDKKKQILLRKAEAQGIDLDEFEMVLELKTEKIQQQANKVQPIETKISDTSIQKLPKIRSDEKERIEKNVSDQSLSDDLGINDLNQYFKQKKTEINQGAHKIKSDVKSSEIRLKSHLRSIYYDEFFWLKVISFPIWFPLWLLWKIIVFISSEIGLTSHLRSIYYDEFFWLKVISFPIWFPLWLLWKIIVFIFCMIFKP